MGKLSPCMAACPIRTDARRYVQAIAHGNFEEALRVLYEVNPIPAVCGRICSRPCEDACRRGTVDEPVAICNLKRFVADNADISLESPPIKYSEKIAVIGSGPAGLTCAYELRKLGYAVKIFEGEPFIGGMLRLGIPLYRLPRSILDKEIEKIKTFGIEIETGKEVDSQFTISDLLEEYQAVFLAVGAAKNVTLNIEGINLPGIYQGVDFLKSVNQGEKPDLGDRVVVVGGGNTAIDSARMARRISGSEVTLIYRRSRDEMPADPREIAEAEAEGIKVMTLVSPIRITDSKNTKEIECVKMELGLPDESGRPRVSPIEGSNFKIQATSIIIAIGQVLETRFSHGKVEIKKGLIQVDSQTMMTNWVGVFAGGDGVTGPSTVVEAMAQGRKAALSIHSFLKGVDLSSLFPPAEPASQIAFHVRENITRLPRAEMPSIPLEKRIKSFEEIEKGYSAGEAIKEAQRCLNCMASAEVNPQLCLGCLTCIRTCPYEVPTLLDSGIAYISPEDCQACGLCVTECPAKAISFSFLPEEHFIREVRKRVRDNGGIVGVFCVYNSYAAAHSLPGIGYPCLGKISLNSLLQSFGLGIKKILMVGCPEENCHFHSGSRRAQKRINYLKSFFPEMGMDENIVELHQKEDPEGHFYLERLKEITDDSR